jgi:DNA segregation ATPase FtsK/SpoIIIE-like protein
MSLFVEYLTEELENMPDKLLDEVKKYFEDSGYEISVSLIQRRFMLGYNRASRIMRQIEKVW